MNADVPPKIKHDTAVICLVTDFNLSAKGKSSSAQTMQNNPNTKLYEDYKRKYTLTTPQQELFHEFFQFLKDEKITIDYSVENEIVFVKNTPIGQTILVIDEEGDGMFSFASRVDNKKHKREFFEYGNYNVVDLTSKFINT